MDPELGKKKAHGKKTSPVASEILKIFDDYVEDPKAQPITAKEGCPLLSLGCDAGEAVLLYRLEWLHQLMMFSSTSHVPFVFYGRGKPVGTGSEGNRSYPRASPDTITISSKVSGAADGLGGRSRIEHSWPFLKYEELYEIDKFKFSGGSTCRFSDVLIVHKRRFANEVVRHTKAKHLICLNRIDKLPEEASVHLASYPLLNIYMAKDFGGKKQGYARMLQLLFATILNRMLLKAGYPHEVVAREGFGSPIPSVSDLGDGIRLDPGLLPPECIPIVIKAIERTGNMFGEIVSNPGDFDGAVSHLDGFGTVKLQNVDWMMHAMLVLQADEGAEDKLDKALIGYLKSPRRLEGKLPMRIGKGADTFIIKIGRAPCLPEPKRKEPSEASGYGSDSDEEFGEDEEGAPAIEDAPHFCVKKASFISGMACINIIMYCAKPYGEVVVGKKEGAPLKGLAESPALAGEYFEIDAKLAPAFFSHYNAAPNPRNAFDAKAFANRLSALVCTVDVTNNTTREKAAIVQEFLRHTFDTGKVWQVLVLEESASKHPTGGDMVYGVVRIVGRRAAVSAFYELLGKHLKYMNKGGESVLTDEEHIIRRKFQSLLLMPRNRDLVAAVNEMAEEKLLTLLDLDESSLL